MLLMKNSKKKITCTSAPKKFEKIAILKTPQHDGVKTTNKKSHTQNSLSLS